MSTRVVSLVLAASLFGCAAPGQTRAPAGTSVSLAPVTSPTALASETRAAKAITARLTEQAAPGGFVVEVTFAGYEVGTIVTWESIRDENGAPMAVGQAFTLGPDLRIRPGALQPSRRFELTFLIADERTVVAVGPPSLTISTPSPVDAPTPSGAVAAGTPQGPISPAIVRFGPAPNVTCAPGQLAPPRALSFSIAPGVRDVDVCDAYDTLGRIGRLLDRTVGTDVIVSATVLIAPSGSTVLPAYGAGNCCTNYGPAALYIVPDNSAWSHPPPPLMSVTAGRLYLLGSQYFHVWQTAGGCRPWSGPRYEPGWFYAGSAEYFAFQLAIAEGKANEADVRGFNVAAALSSPTSLRGVEESGPVDVFQGANKAYNLGYLATERLVGRYGWSGIRAFCGSLGPSIPRGDAFQRAFGGSLANFYDDFDRWRADGFQ